MNLVFNELSLEKVSLTKEIGKSMIEMFISVYHAAVTSKYRFSYDIITTVDINSCELSVGYYASQWRNEHDIDRDLIRRFKSICQRQVMISACTYSDDSEFTCENGVSVGCLLAFDNRDVVISMGSCDYWKQYTINGEIYFLETNKTEQIEIVNISAPNHLIQNEDNLEKLLKFELMSIKSGEQLINSLSTLFPNLIFSYECRSQLKTEVEAQHLNILIKKLREIDHFFENWDGKIFDEKQFQSKVTPQSKETLKRFPTDHTFEVGGKIVLVSYHMRYTGNIPGRIYFEPDFDRKIGLICSLTTKLRTVTDTKSNV